MQTALMISQVVISVLLMVTILIQNKDGGLSTVMGGSMESFHATRRGAEKVVYIATIVLAVLFMANALLFVVI